MCIALRQLLVKIGTLDESIAQSPMFKELQASERLASSAVLTFYWDTRDEAEKNRDKPEKLRKFDEDASMSIQIVFG